MGLIKKINRREKYLMMIIAETAAITADAVNTDKIEQWLGISIIDCDPDIIELAKKEGLKETDSIADLMSVRADKYLLNEIK